MGPSREDVWKAQYIKLVEYKEKSGTTKVPRRDHEHLYIWCYNQRKNRRDNNPSLTEDKINLLNDIAFVWDIQSTPGRGRPRKLKAVEEIKKQKATEKKGSVKKVTEEEDTEKMDTDKKPDSPKNTVEEEDTEKMDTDKKPDSPKDTVEEKDTEKMDTNKKPDSPKNVVEEEDTEKMDTNKKPDSPKNAVEEEDTEKMDNDRKPDSPKKTDVKKRSSLKAIGDKQSAISTVAATAELVPPPQPNTTFLAKSYDAAGWVAKGAGELLKMFVSF